MCIICLYNAWLRHVHVMQERVESAAFLAVGYFAYLMLCKLE